mgnify:CR=1 FL=1
MDVFDSIRRVAEELHQKATAIGGDPFDPLALVTIIVEQLPDLEFELIWLDPDNPGLKGARARFDDQAGIICCENAGNPASRALLVAHELGHAKLHAGSLNCGPGEVDASRTIEAAAFGLQRVETYGARERQELQANVFARELVLPRSLARKLHLEENRSAKEIIEATGLPTSLVRQQLFDALLLPQDDALVGKVTPAPKPEPDPSQDRAVDHRGSPFLLQAGPGTGKTRTLIKRIVALIEEGADPASILVLTFSNRAAGELSERLHEVISEGASKVWVGTFHAFGLDVVRRYYRDLNLRDAPILFDRSDAIEVLEEILPTLPLIHYRNLWDPTLVLRDILDAISRAKDELVAPDRYRALAQQMLQKAENAGDQDQIKAAEKCMEIADVYDLYERTLSDRGGIDFGDLVMRPAMLVQANRVVRSELQLRHRHVLVDEYQDVNRASARLVNLISADAKRLWVVGDARQSIYRFRGASSENMVRFTDDYDNATIDKLEINYRSSEQIVDSFCAITPRMAASKGMLPLNLTANKGAGATKTEVRRFEKPDDEIEGIAACIKDLQGQKVVFRDQVVLCRTNKRLNEIAAGLEARGVPVLHLGSLFERNEIRDLLALLSIAVDPFGDAMVRVGALPRYGLTLQDVYHVSRTIKEGDHSTLQGLAALQADTRLSPEGRKGIARLVNDLLDLRSTSTAWEFMASYLLDRTPHVRDLASSGTISGQMKAVAIWQFMNFLRDQSPVKEGVPIERTLSRIRQMVLLAEERDLRQVPAAALHMDAVRLMTVHGSKGLEFDAVHVPGLTVASFPSSNRGQRCPPPDGMIEGSTLLTAKEFAKQAHLAEEECLFFVAISRARKHLNLYLTRKQLNGKNRSESEFLEWLPSHLVTHVDKPKQHAGPKMATDPNTVRVQWADNWMITESRLTAYERCPRRFFYTHVMGLGSARKMTAFSKTHDCIYDLIRWLNEARTKSEPTLSQTEDIFENIWQKRGPVEHAYAAEYRQLASQFIRNLLDAGAGRFFLDTKRLTVTLPNGSIFVEPSEIAKREDGRIAVRRVRTGYCRSDEYTRLEYALYKTAALSEYGLNAIVEALHLTDNIDEPVRMTDRVIANRIKSSNEMLGKVLAGRFPPDVDPISCPRCPHFFICAATPDGDLKQS